MDELEMIKDMCPDYGTMCDKCNANGYCSVEYTAKRLINKNYHKVTDDEVVLKFDDLVKRDEKIKDYAERHARKMVVREILQELFPKEGLTVEHDFDIGADGKEKRYELRYFLIYEDEVKDIAKKHGIVLE